MNEEIILKMVEPYLKNSSITYMEFDVIFDFLSRREQYLITDILFANNIMLRDDEEIELFTNESSNSKEEIEILYDDNIFKDDEFLHSQSNTVYYQNIYQSNEILCSLIQDGNEQAKQDLCVKNEKLVDKYVLAYQKYFGNRLDVEDIRQAGFIGLIKAGEKFDVRLGYSFSTYATYWIRQSIVREIFDYGFLIRVPVHMMERINKVIKLDNKFRGQGLNSEDRIQKISNEIGISEELVKEALIIRGDFLSCSSLNTPIGEGDTELEEFIVDKEGLSVEEIVTSHMLHLQLMEVLTTLSEREQKILSLRFGLQDENPKTLEEIGKEFNLTRERIRQIEVKALHKLQHPSRAKKLRDYL